MFRTRRQELIWLILIGGCVALFVAHRERAHQAPAVAAYDRSGFNDLVRQTMAAPVAHPDDDLVTGAISKPAKRARKARYYVPLGSYDSIEDATRRYLDIVHREPRIEDGRKLRIETVALDGGRFHRVRMGDFGTTGEAKAACRRAGLTPARCPVVEVR